MAWLPQVWQWLQGVLGKLTEPTYIAAIGALLSGLGALGIRAEVRRRSHRNPSRAATNKSRSTESTQASKATSTSLSRGAQSQGTHIGSVGSSDGTSRSRGATQRAPRDPYREAARKAAQELSKLTVIVYWLAGPHQEFRYKVAHEGVLAFILSLYGHLRSFHESAKELNKRLAKLDISWDNDDPRLAMFACANPFSTLYRDSDVTKLVSEFDAGADKIVRALRDRGYFMWRQRGSRDDGPWFYEVLDWNSRQESFSYSEELVEVAEDVVKLEPIETFVYEEELVDAPTQTT